jgi:hypothetical protein
MRGRSVSGALLADSGAGAVASCGGGVLSSVLRRNLGRSGSSGSEGAWELVDVLSEEAEPLPVVPVPLVFWDPVPWSRLTKCGLSSSLDLSRTTVGGLRDGCSFIGGGGTYGIHLPKPNQSVPTSRAPAISNQPCGRPEPSISYSVPLSSASGTGRARYRPASCRRTPSKSDTGMSRIALGLLRSPVHSSTATERSVDVAAGFCFVSIRPGYCAHRRPAHPTAITAVPAFTSHLHFMASFMADPAAAIVQLPC